MVASPAHSAPGHSMSIPPPWGSRLCPATCYWSPQLFEPSLHHRNNCLLEGMQDAGVCQGLAQGKTERVATNTSTVINADEWNSTFSRGFKYVNNKVEGACEMALMAGGARCRDLNSFAVVFLVGFPFTSCYEVLLELLTVAALTEKSPLLVLHTVLSGAALV